MSKSLWLLRFSKKVVAAQLGCSTGSGLLEKNVQKPDCMFYHCDVMILSMLS